MINVTINGRSYSAEENTTILDIAKANQIYIPTLCYLEGVSDVGSCRLCVVAVEGFERLLPACRTIARDGMVITTDSEDIQLVRFSAVTFRQPRSNLPALAFLLIH